MILKILEGKSKLDEIEDCPTKTKKNYRIISIISSIMLGKNALFFK